MPSNLNLDYYHGTEAEQFNFCRVPKILLTDPRYKSISIEAKDAESAGQNVRGTPMSLNASILSGIALFLKTYETELDDNIFIKRMSVVEPEEIIRRGKSDAGLRM